MSEPTREHWLVRAKTIRLMWRGGFVVLALTVLSELLVESYSSFGIDGTFGFYAWFGFAACVAMVLFAKGLGVFIKRPDTYYDD